MVKGENRVWRFHFTWMLAGCVAFTSQNVHIRKKVMNFKSHSHVDMESMKMKI